jgi:hypothetical protein
MPLKSEEVLKYEEVSSAAWQKLKEHINKKIEAKRKANDKDHDEVKTAKLRGEIKALKELITDVEPVRLQTKRVRGDTENTV